jgi:hypothetical protein
MTVRRHEGGGLELAGRCGVEDAEVLQRHLLADRRAAVQWTDCEYLHSAVVQVLLAGRVSLRGTPKSAFLRVHLAPVLRRSADGTVND